MEPASFGRTVASCPLLAPTVDVALRDGATVRVRPMVAEDEPALTRLPRRAVGRVALAAVLQRRRRPPPGRLVHGGARAGARARPHRRRRRARADRRPRRVHPRAGPAARRSRVRGRRRLAGPRHRHGAARAPVRARDRRGHRDVHRHRAARQPPDDPGLPRLRLRRRGRVASGRADRSSCPPRSGRRRERASRSATRSPPRPPSPMSCGPRRSRSSACRAARARSARPCCATCARPASRAGSRSCTRARRRSAALPAHRSIADVPEPVELAVIAVPAESVVDVARECGAAGVRALVVLSAGFAEVGRAAATARRSCSPSAAPAGCGSSARTASACSTPPRTWR